MQTDNSKNPYKRAKISTSPFIKTPKKATSKTPKISSGSGKKA